MVIFVRPFQSWVISHIRILFRLQEAPQFSHFLLVRDSSYCQLLWTMMWGTLHVFCKLHPHNDTTKQVLLLLTPFYDENLRIKESKLCSYYVTALRFEPNFKPQVISIPPLNYSNQQLFFLTAAFLQQFLSLQHHLLYWYMSWLLKKIKFSDGRNSVGTFSLVPWQSLLLHGGPESKKLTRMAQGHIQSAVKQIQA